MNDETRQMQEKGFVFFATGKVCRTISPREIGLISEWVIDGYDVKKPKFSCSFVRTDAIFYYVKKYSDRTTVSADESG